MPDPSVLESQQDGGTKAAQDTASKEEPAEEGEEEIEEEEWMPTKQQFLDLTTVVNKDEISDNTLQYISYGQLHHVTA